MHALLATSAVHHHLIKAGVRCDCNIIVETGTARDAHHVACLIGYGATAVYPYMAYQCLSDMLRTGEINPDYSRRQLGRSYRRGIRKGLLKIMSKMGISTIASYRGACLFEIVGLQTRSWTSAFRVPSVESRAPVSQISNWTGANSQRVPGIRRVSTSQGGLLKYVDGGEYHMYNAEVIGSLQAAVRTDDRSEYQRFRDIVNERPASALRDLLGLRMALDRSRWMKSNLSRRSCGASIVPACHWARCRPKRTRRWRSR